MRFMQEPGMVHDELALMQDHAGPPVQEPGQVQEPRTTVLMPLLPLLPLPSIPHDSSGGLQH